MTAYRTPSQDALLYFAETIQTQSEVQQDRNDLFVNVTQNSQEIEAGHLTCSLNPKIRHAPRDWTACVVGIEGKEEMGRPRLLLGVPAEVRPDERGGFTLRPPTKSGIRRLPSIPVDLLDIKRVDKSGFVLGPVEEADRWLLQQRTNFSMAAKSADWSLWWRLSLGLAASVMKCDSNVLAALEEKLGPNSRVTIKIYEANECSPLLKPLYNVLRTAVELKRPPALLEAWLCQVGDLIATGNIRSQIDRAAKFTAVMDNYEEDGTRRAFPLDPSQREAVFYGLGTGKITAVQGPPGSGKTALLRAYAASMMVNAVLEDAPEPPFILATSATNLAVTNVIKDFSGAAKPFVGTTGAEGTFSELPSLASRWIPGAQSFGWFQPARSYLDKIRRNGGTKFEGEEERGPVDMNSLPILDHCLSEAERLAGNRSNELEGLAFRTDTFGTSASVNGLFNGENLGDRLLQASNFWVKSFDSFAKARNLAAVDRPTNDLRDCQAVIRQAMLTVRAILKENVASQHAVNASFRRFMAEPRQNMADSLTDSLWAASYKHGQGFCDNLRLESAMSEVQQNIAEMIASAAALGDRSTVDEAAKARFATSAQVVFDGLQNVLDLGPRAAAFHLASRYWEGDFLNSRIGRVLNPSAYGRRMQLLAETKGPTAAIRGSLREVLALGPVIVSTVYALPSFFRFRNIPEAGFNAADSLIIDEASLCQPEIITPALAFAQKAFVVGDVRQLEPVSKITPQHEREIRESVVGDIEKTPFPKDLFVTSGSAMLIAARASGTKNLMLRGHYRCRPEIMSFFSRLCYNNLLVPMRPPRTDTENFHFAPPMGMLLVDSEARKLKSGSMDNKAEAKAIAEYLARNADQIEELFDQPIEACIGVLAPFTAQRSTLSAEIKRAFAQRGKMLRANIEPKWAEAAKTAGENGTYTKKYGPRADITRQMVIGTVHQFQGGQKKMMIVSMVADGLTKETSARFIDQSVNLLNVACSRACESLLVFASPNLANRDDRSAFTPSMALLSWMSKKGVILDMPAPLDPPSVDGKSIRDREAGEFARDERGEVGVEYLLPSAYSPDLVITTLPEVNRTPETNLAVSATEIRSAEDVLGDLCFEVTGITVQPDIVRQPQGTQLTKAMFEPDRVDQHSFHDAPPDIELPPLSAYEEDYERHQGGGLEQDDRILVPDDFIYAAGMGVSLGTINDAEMQPAHTETCITAASDDHVSLNELSEFSV